MLSKALSLSWIPSIRQNMTSRVVQKILNFPLNKGTPIEISSQRGLSSTERGIQGSGGATILGDVQEMPGLSSMV